MGILKSKILSSIETLWKFPYPQTKYVRNVVWCLARKNITSIIPQDPQYNYVDNTVLLVKTSTLIDDRLLAVHTLWWDVHVNSAILTIVIYWIFLDTYLNYNLKWYQLTWLIIFETVFWCVRLDLQQNTEHHTRHRNNEHFTAWRWTPSCTWWYCLH